MVSLMPCRRMARRSNRLQGGVPPSFLLSLLSHFAWTVFLSIQPGLNKPGPPASGISLTEVKGSGYNEPRLPTYSPWAPLIACLLLVEWLCELFHRLLRLVLQMISSLFAHPPCSKINTRHFLLTTSILTNGNDKFIMIVCRISAPLRKREKYEFHWRRSVFLPRPYAPSVSVRDEHIRSTRTAEGSRYLSKDNTYYPVTGRSVCPRFCLPMKLRLEMFFALFAHRVFARSGL